MARPNPADYKNESVSPTKILNQPFVIQDIQEDEFEGKPQLCITAKIANNPQDVDIYVSNRYVMRFLRDIKGQSYMSDPLAFHKSNPSQRHYEIGWVDELDLDIDLPF